MTAEDMATQVAVMISHAAAGEAARAADMLTDLGVQSDNAQMYGICCATAEMGTAALRKLNGGTMPDIAAGDMWVLDDLKPSMQHDPADLFAIRFLVAYANGDNDITLALFIAAVDASDEEYAQSVAALVANVSGIVRLAISEGDPDDDR